MQQQGRDDFIDAGTCERGYTMRLPVQEEWCQGSMVGGDIRMMWGNILLGLGLLAVGFMAGMLVTLIGVVRNDG